MMFKKIFYINRNLLFRLQMCCTWKQQNIKYIFAQGNKFGTYGGGAKFSSYSYLV